MMMKKFISIFSVLLLISCGEKEETKNQAVESILDTQDLVVEQEKSIPKTITSSLALNKSSFASLKDWNTDQVEKAVSAFYRSCPKILQEQKEYMGGAKIKVLTKSYQEACRVLPLYQPHQYREFLENNFVPYEIAVNGRTDGRFTSYYEMMFEASRTKTIQYTYPIYGRPANLFEVQLKKFDENLPNKKIVGRLEGIELVPYYTRSEILQNAEELHLRPILYVHSSIHAFIAQIQGSAVGILENGEKQRIAYAGDNGRPFTGIGKILLDNNELKPNELNMLNIKHWLFQNSDKAHYYMNQNQRFVFHKLSYEDAPIGAMGVPLTAGRSLAIDPDYIPLGSLLWLETSYPERGAKGKLVVAQDTGGAIKGPIRGDYFWGSGGDEVLRLAGSMNSSGKYFILVPKNAEVWVQ